MPLSLTLITILLAVVTIGYVAWIVVTLRAAGASAAATHKGDSQDTHHATDDPLLTELQPHQKQAVVDQADHERA